MHIGYIIIQIYHNSYICLLILASQEIIIIICLLVTVNTFVVCQRDDWVEPHAWGGARRSSMQRASGKPSACPSLECNCAAAGDCPELSTVCPAVAECNCPEAAVCDDHSEYLYRKLVNYIFNVNNVKVILLSYSTQRS